MYQFTTCGVLKLLPSLIPLQLTPQVVMVGLRIVQELPFFIYFMTEQDMWALLHAYSFLNASAPQSTWGLSAPIQRNSLVQVRLWHLYLSVASQHPPGLTVQWAACSGAMWTGRPSIRVTLEVDKTCFSVCLFEHRRHVVSLDFPTWQNWQLMIGDHDLTTKLSLQGALCHVSFQFKNLPPLFPIPVMLFTFLSSFLDSLLVFSFADSWTAMFMHNLWLMPLTASGDLFGLTMPVCLDVSHDLF